MPTVPPKRTLVQSIKATIPTDLTKKPLWPGPGGEGPQGGISQSLLGRFLACRARAKVHLIDGWQGPDAFKPALEYGNLWHCCEEANEMWEATNTKRGWRAALKAHITELANKYPMDREKISHWYSLCEEEYAIYLDYWQEEGEIVGREPLLREQNFDVPYTLPSGRKVRLRGKWDGLDLIETPKMTASGKRIPNATEKGLYLYENKTKSQIDAPKLQKQLSFDLQTMFYLVALQMTENISSKPFPIKGVLYNVIKRSQHKSATSMVKKIHEDLDDNRGGEWFGRWTVDITPQEIETFKKEFLHPVLENLCVWYDIVTNLDGLRHVSAFDLTRMMHWRHPNGMYNPVDENGGTEVDNYLNTGSTVGLVKIKTLFPELDGSK